MTSCEMLHKHIVITSCMRHLTAVKLLWCQSLVGSSILVLIWQSQYILVPQTTLYTSQTCKQECIRRQMTVSVGISSSYQLVESDFQAVSNDYLQMFAVDYNNIKPFILLHYKLLVIVEIRTAMISYRDRKSS